MSTTAVAEQPAETAAAIPADGAKAATPATSTDTGTAVESPAAESDTAKGSGTETPASGPPEAYALTVADPELVSADALKAFEAEAKALGLSQAQAQAALDRRIDGVLAQSETFRKEVEADPVYGGAKLAETQQYAEAALNRFAPKGTPLGDRLRGLMRESGYGNALPIVALLAQIGKAAAEDRPVEGEQRTATEPVIRAADRAYRTSTSAHLFKDAR